MNPSATRRNVTVVSETILGTVSGMTSTSGTRRVGRPSKGDRHAIHVRMPRHLADRVMGYAGATGKSYGEVINELVERHQDEIDPASVKHGDNRLDLEGGRRTA